MTKKKDKENTVNDTITINIIEVASELADKEMREQCLELKIDVEDEDGTVHYTEEAQDIHDELYDHYYEFLKNLAL